MSERRWKRRDLQWSILIPFQPHLSKQLAGCLKSWIPQPFYASINSYRTTKSCNACCWQHWSVLCNVHTEEKALGLPRRVTFGAFRMFNDSGEFYVITMYSGFAISGVIDLLILFVYFPWPTSLLFFTLALVCNGIPYWFHMGHTKLNALYVSPNSSGNHNFLYNSLLFADPS